MKNKIFIIILLILSVLSSISIVYFGIKSDINNRGGFDLYLNFSLYSTYFLMALSGILLFGFALWFIIFHFQQSKNSLVGVGVLALILLISYIISSPSASEIETKFEISAGMSKFIGGGLIATYLFMIGCVLAALWSSISTRFK